MPRRLLAPRRAGALIWAKWQVRSAVRQAGRIHRTHPASVRVCWDLDNTLVDSGSLIRAGKQLEEAIVEAAPVPNMLGFFDALASKLPDASHFILSARPNVMRKATLNWLSRHGVLAAPANVCFLPYASAKPRVWARLARDARLVIVDDLSYGHEHPEVSVYVELVEFARRTASVYVGLEEILRIGGHHDEIEVVASWVADAVSGDVLVPST